MEQMTVEAGRADLLLQQLGACTSQFDVFRCLREVTQSYGFRYFSVNSMPRDSQFRLSDTVIITSAPSDLIKRQDGFESSESNPVVAAIRATGAPFEVRFGERERGDSRKFDRVEQILSEFDLSTWLIVPVFTPGAGEAVISYLGNRPSLKAFELAELALLSSKAKDRLTMVSAQDKPQASPLTERELECVVWTAAGKTSVEIAKILNLSEHTVNHYLNNATRKSGTVNRTQTVASALRNGWID
ncbi:helix-turn-helix transcriptional regulator [Pseudohoeflea suaedae]|nr:LuxR C-terminal-related transcriptional regulator [Pseudohoeflea suaedae]